MKIYLYNPKRQGEPIKNSNNPKRTTSKLKPVPQSLFKTANSLDAVITYANAQLPTVDRNVLYALFMMYHNTLLDQVDQKTQSLP